MVGDDLGWLNGGREDGYFSAPFYFLGRFLATKASSGSVSQLGFVCSYERSTVVVAAWLEMACSGRKDVGVTVLYFWAALLS